MSILVVAGIVTAIVTAIVMGFGAGFVTGRRAERRWRRAERAVGGDVPPPERAEFAPSFGELVEGHPSGVVVAAPGGAITFRNAAARAMGGTHVGVLLDAAVERHVAAARAGGRSDEVLELYGPPKTVLALAARPTPDGGAVVFIDDISERRRIEQVRTDFVANISHELKTPVGAMSVLAETLDGETDPETIKRVAQRLMGEADRASRTIDDLMELSRIELGGERELGEVRIAEVVGAAVDRVTELAAQRGVRIVAPDAAADGGGDPARVVIVGDRRQLVSALGNLVENAVKFSEPDGLVQVAVSAVGDVVEIAVIDEGVGIPQRDLPRIFERFYRVDRARSRATGGTGLGLSIVRHVATNHDGQVEVTSVEGEGSTFTLRLPVRLAGPAAGEGAA